MQEAIALGGTEGETWFVATDVARALGYERPNNAVSSHCKKVSKINYPESGQPCNIIPVSDVYRLALRSNLASAERFQDWVCEDILPTIAKTGRYEMTPTAPALPQDYPSALRALADEAEQRALAETKALALAAQNSAVAPTSRRVARSERLNDGRVMRNGGRGLRKLPVLRGECTIPPELRMSDLDVFSPTWERLESLESGDEAVGKDGPISAYAPWADIDLSQGGSDTRVSVNPNGGRNPHSPYAPLPTASEETPSSATRGCALIPGGVKLPPHSTPVKRP